MHRPTSALSARLLSPARRLVGRQPLSLTSSLLPLQRRPALGEGSLTRPTTLLQPYSQDSNPAGKTRRSSKDTDSASPSANPAFPKLSFETLGITGPMKWLIIAILSVFGTIETWVWCKMIWRWWKGGKEEGPVAPKGEA